MQFTFCLITKNEERYLEACLTPLKKTGMPIVVLDTGSTDQTVTIARQFTNDVYDFTWQNDFALARNACAAKAKTDYIYFIDADEITTSVDVKSILKQIQDFPEAVGQFKRISLSPDGEGTCESIDYPERLYNRRIFHYEGRIHEQVTYIDSTKKNAPLPYYVAKHTVRHEGYIGTLAARKEKAERNIALLLVNLKDTPDDPYIYYQLGLAYRLYDAYAEADPYLEKGVSLATDYSLRYVTDLIITYGQNLNKLEHFADAAALVKYLPHYKKNADFLCMLAYAFMNKSCLSEALALYQKAATLPEASIIGNNTSVPHHNMGCIYEATGNLTLARKHYLQAGDYPPSLSKLSSLPANEITLPSQFCIICIWDPAKENMLKQQLDQILQSTLPLNQFILAIVGPSSPVTISLENKYPDSVALFTTESVPTRLEAIETAASYELAPSFIVLPEMASLPLDSLRILTAYEKATNAEACVFYNNLTQDGNDVLLSGSAPLPGLPNTLFDFPQNGPSLLSLSCIKKALQVTGPGSSSIVEGLLSTVSSVAVIGKRPENLDLS